MALFFDEEKEMAQSRFRSDIIISELKGQIDLADGWTKLGKPATQIANKLEIIKNEIVKLNKEEIVSTQGFIGELVPQKFTHEVADQAKTYLSKMKSYFDSCYQTKRDEKELLIQQINKEKGINFLVDQKMKNLNKSLETLVLNSDTREIFRQTPCGYMQKIAPIYKDPDFRNGRAHFLASEKRVAGVKADTFIFNLFVIWSMSIFLYIALYFDWLRKILAVSPKLISVFKNSVLRTLHHRSVKNRPGV